ncbi:MAG: glycosyltransferase family 39 protein [Dissulfuribacterales bacterium]
MNKVSSNIISAVSKNGRTIQTAAFVLTGLLAVRLWLAAVLPLTDNTEARYAEIARKMVETANWVTPQFAYNVPFWGKPPLAFWLSAAGIQLFGSNELAARSGILLVSIGVAAFFYLWLRRKFDVMTAGYATLMLCSSALYFISAGAVMTDMVLTAAVTLALIGFWLRLKGSQWYWEAALYLGMGLGLLAKGPIALIFILCPVFLWATATRNLSKIWREFAWIRGGILAAAIAVPWYVIAELRTPGFLEYFIIGEHIKRFLVSGWTGDLYGHAHSAPIGMIWLYFLLAVSPWTFIVPIIAYKYKDDVVQNWKDNKSIILFCIYWAVCPMLLFTFAHNILWTYALPGIPGAIAAMAILTKGITKNIEEKILKTTNIIVAYIVIIILIFSTIIISISEKYSQRNIIAKINQSCPDNKCGIYYWNKRLNSAEFYSFGKSKTMAKQEQIENILNDNKKDFIVVLDKKSSGIPDKIKDKFIIAYRTDNSLLLEEK